jgi:hypothetical protein
MLQNKTQSLKFKTNPLFRQTTITTIKTLPFSQVNALDGIQAEPPKTTVKDLVQLFENTTGPPPSADFSVSFLPKQ